MQKLDMILDMYKIISPKNNFLIGLVVFMKSNASVPC